MNKAILRNSEILIFDKKNNLAAAQVSFFKPLDWRQIFFSRRPYVYSFAWIKDLIDKTLLNTRKPRGDMFHAFVGMTSFKPNSHTFVKAEQKAVNFVYTILFLHKI